MYLSKVFKKIEGSFLNRKQLYITISYASEPRLLEPLIKVREGELFLWHNDCIWLWYLIPHSSDFLSSEEAFDQLPQSTVPEMQRSNLAPVILQLKALGIDNVLRFHFMSVSPAFCLSGRPECSQGSVRTLIQSMLPFWVFSLSSCVVCRVQGNTARQGWHNSVLVCWGRETSKWVMTVPVPGALRDKGKARSPLSHVWGETWNPSGISAGRERWSYPGQECVCRPRCPSVMTGGAKRALVELQGKSLWLIAFLIISQGQFPGVGLLGQRAMVIS